MTEPNGLFRASTPALLWLAQVPRWLLAAVLIALLLGGLAAAAPWGSALLLLLAAFLGWLAVLSWPAATPGGRVLRALTVLLLVGAAVRQLS